MIFHVIPMVKPNSREDRNIEKKKNLRIWGPGQEFRNLPQFLANTTKNQGQEFRNCANRGPRTGIQKSSSIPGSDHQKSRPGIPNNANHTENACIMHALIWEFLALRSGGQSQDLRKNQFSEFLALILGGQCQDLRNPFYIPVFSRIDPYAEEEYRYHLGLFRQECRRQ